MTTYEVIQKEREKKSKVVPVVASTVKRETKQLTSVNEGNELDLRGIQDILEDESKDEILYAHRKNGVLSAHKLSMNSKDSARHEKQKDKGKENPGMLIYSPRLIKNTKNAKNEDFGMKSARDKATNVKQKESKSSKDIKVQETRGISNFGDLKSHKHSGDESQIRSENDLLQYSISHKKNFHSESMASIGFRKEAEEDFDFKIDQSLVRDTDILNNEKEKEPDNM